MITCPNKNLKSWKNLVKARGENEAYNLWFLYKGIVPQEEYVTEEIVEPSPVVEEPIAEPTFMRVPQANPLSLEEEQEYIPEYTEPETPPTKEEFNALLKSKLFEFIKGLGVEINENADDILNNLNLNTGNALSAFDTLQKYLALGSNISKKDLLLQNANIIYTFLGKKSLLAIELWKNIPQWSKYNEIYSYYDKYKTQEDADLSEEIEYTQENFNVFAHKQAIIHFIAGALDYGIKNNYTGEKRDNPDLDKSYFENLGYKDKYEQNWLKALFNKIWNFINETILNNPAVREYNEAELKDLVLDIVDDVFKNDYKKFIRSYYTNEQGQVIDSKGNEFEQKFYEETLNKDPFAKKIIEQLFSDPFMNYKLSGSQVLRKYGAVLRAVDEDLHDIDGVIPLDTFKKEANSRQFYNWIQTRGLFLMQNRNTKTFIKEITPLLEDQSWYKNLKRKFPTWKLENTFIGRDHKKGESVTITGYIEHPTDTEIDKDTGLVRPKRYVLDFFLRTVEGNYPEIFDNYWKDWKQIFEAKLNMGRAKDLNDLIYFKPFIQDKYKFTNKGFRYFTFAELPKKNKESNVYYQKSTEKPTSNEIKPGVEELFESDSNLANQVYEALGFTETIPTGWEEGKTIYSKGKPVKTDFKSGITELPNGNYLVRAYRTDDSGKGSKGFGQRGEGLYLSLTNPYPGKDVNTVEFEINPSDIVTYKEEFKNTISYDKLKKRTLEFQFHDAIKEAGGKAFIGGINSSEDPNLEIVLYDNSLIERANKSKKKVSNFTTNYKLYNLPTEVEKQQALQAYSQYLDTLNKPNTNPVLQSNQQEQVKKFAELQERLSNKEFLEGAKGAYESTPALQQYGTQEEYNDYIARVSLGILKNPSSGGYNYTSKVKDIVYHGSKAKFEKFDKSKLGSNTNPNKEFPQFNDSYLGFHFTSNPEYYRNRHEFGSKQEQNLNEYIAILNIKNPKDIADKDEFSQNNIQFIKPEEVKNNDSIIHDYLDTVDFTTGNKVFNYTNNYVVFKPEQIHILGSKQDIEGFKEFAQSSTSVKPGVQELKENTTLANQISNNATEQINEELNNKLQEIVEQLGFTVEALDSLTDENGQPLDAVAKVDILNKIIQYSEGKADISTMPEETAHIFIELMGEEHPLVQKMLNEIENFDIYQEVLDEYGSDPEYLNEDGTQNILKLKKEAIGKLVAAKIVDQFQDSSKENERKATNWFNAIITKLKELFKGLGILGANELVNKAKGKNLNAFEKTAAKILSGNIKGLKKTGTGVYYQKSAPSQVEVAKSYLDAQAKIIKDESKETDRYTVNGESGYTSATEISHAEFRKKNPNYVATKEDEATKNMGILTHAFQADYIAEMFPEYNKHVKRLTTAEKARYARFIAITREGLKGIVEEAKKNGSIMIAELLVANTKTKIAGTIDLLEIKLDGKAKIYDLKTRKSKEVYQKKLDEFGVQLNEYRKILQKGDPNLGTIPLTVDKTRFIGARVTFLKGTTIPGNLVFDKDKRGKILGRPTAYEKTGISEIDKLTAKLTSQVELLETKLKGASKEQKDIIKSQIANKRKIIEEIQITESISSIIEEAGADLRNIEGLLLNETYDPTTDFKDLQDTLTLYSMMHQFIPTAMMEKMSKTEKFQIDFLVGKSKALQDSLNRLVEDAVKQAVLTTGIVGQGDIKTIEDVMGAQKNVSLWKRWFTGISFSTHPLLITVKKLVDKALNVSRNKLNGLKEEIKIATDKLIAATGRSGLDVFDPFYQKLEDGTLTGDLVDEFRPEFYRERARAKREKNLKWYETNTTFDKEKYLKWFENKKKFLQGIESLEKSRIKEAFLHPDSKTDEKVKNSEELLNKAVSRAYETKVKRELEEWVAANKDNIYEFNKPKNQWKDARYTAVQNNPALKEYYDLYKRVMEEIQEFLPQDVKRNFIPNFSVDFVELAARVGLSEASKTLKDSTLNSLDLTYDEARYGKTSSITGENINSIPIQGLTKLAVGEKSLDLSQILAKFAESAYRYKELSGIENSVLMISNYVNGQEVLKLSALGEPILDKYNQIKSELTKKTASDQLKDYIDNIFYNKKRNADVGFETESGKTISLNKIGDKVLGYTALNNLALNLFAPVVNSIQGNVTAVIQSAKGQFFSTGNYMEALGLSATQNKKAQLFLKKFGSTMGEFDNEDYSDLSVLMSKKVLKQDHAFSLMKIGEHQVQHDVLLAMLLSNKHAINYSDYDVVNGKLVWVNKTKKEPSSEEISAFEQKVLKVNKLVVGNNDSDDMMAIKKTFAGRALVQHRGWLPAMAEERFSKRRYDHDLQMWMEGRYVTLWNATLKPLYNLVFRQRNDFKNWWSSMDDTQKANMKANFMEMALIGAVLLIGAGLHGDDDDKERRRDLAYLIRVNNRVYSELTFFSNMTSAYQILISPAAAISTVQNAGKVFSNTYNFIQEQDEKSGQKALKSTLKMLPPLGALEKAWNVKRDYIDR